MRQLTWGGLLFLSLWVGLLFQPTTSFAKKKADEPLAKLKYSNGSEKENELRALKAEMLITKSEQKAITQVQKLLKKYRGTQLEPDLLFRLGELYMRRAKTDRFLELHRSSEVVVSVAPKLVENAASKKQIDQAISIYDQIQKRFPNYERIDVVIFNNAFANQQTSRLERSEKLYRLLIKEFPQSVLVPDSHLAIGEMMFNQRQFNVALNHFHAIRAYPDSMVYPYGLYKAAWALYNLHDAAGGMKQLEDVIQYGRFVAERGIDARLDLRKEALLDLALFYEDAFPAKDAFKYLSMQARELDASPVVLRLSKLYKRHDRHQDNTILLTDFIQRLERSQYVPLVLIELMDANEKMKKSKNVVDLLQSLSFTCESDSKWSLAQNNGTVVSKDSPLIEMNESVEGRSTPSELCRKLFEKTALMYANRWLKQWQRSSADVESGISAEKAFGLYLAKTPESQSTARARFVYADLLFSRSQYLPASENYALAAKRTNEPKISHDGRYFAVLAWEKHVNGKWSEGNEKKFKELVADYVRNQPSGQYLLDLEFKLALIAYDKKRYDEAGEKFLLLGQKFGTTEKGLRAQDIYLDILNAKKDFAGVRDYAVQVRRSATGDRKAKLTKIYEEAYFLLVQEKESAGDFKSAASDYEKFYHQNSESPLGQKALWNSVQLLYKSGDALAGARASVKYYEKYPRHPESKDSLIKAAQTYEAMGQLMDAAEVLYLLAKVDSQNEEKWLVMTADFYTLARQEKKALPIYEKLRKSSNREVADQALDQLVAFSKNSNQSGNYESLLKEMIATGREPRASFGMLYFSELDYNAGRFSQAFESSKKILARDKAGAAKSTLARARLLQARILAAEFRAQSVRSQMDRLQLVLQIKTEKLEKSQIAYQSAAKYGDAEVTVQAYRELADCYLHYSESLQAMPVPKGLPETEGAVFREEISKLAIPMEERGIETKMLALKTSRDFHTGHSRDLQNEMSKLNQVVTEDATPKINPPAVLLPKVEGV